MGLVRSFIGTDGIWQYIPHINTGLFSIIKVHFLLFANLIVDWHINTINFTDSGINKGLSAKVPDTKARVVTDEKWFSFCLEQLLSNSIKYTCSGGIRFLAEEGEREICLTVEDTGIGIRAEDLPRIFEKGFTGYNGRLDKRSTGIGLYLCRQVLGHLGIKIRAESQVGCGTRMRLTIPKPYKTVR